MIALLLSVALLDEPALPDTAQVSAAVQGAVEERRLRLPIVGDATVYARAAAAEDAAAVQRPGAPADPRLEKDLEALGLPLILRLVETPRAFLLFVSGDGGWSGLDKTLVDTLAKKGISTVAINTLKYFWSEKPPDVAAADLKRIADVVKRDRLPLYAGGYSFGAEVIPVLVGRAEFKGTFDGLVMISPGPHASFEVSVLDWLRSREKPTAYGVLQHTRALAGMPVFCSAGEQDDEAICGELRGQTGAEVALLPGSHHYNGKYDQLADLVAAFLGRLLEPKTAARPTP